MSFKRCLVLFALVFAGAGLVQAQEETYVCADGQGVMGDSVDPDHTGWITAYGLDHVSVGDPTAGSSTFTPVSILKGTDSASVRLHQLAALRNSLGKVVIDVCRSGSDCYYSLVLETVWVTQIGVAGSACVDTGTSCTPAQTESVSFGSFARITWVHHDSATSYCWDVASNLPCAQIPTTDCTP